MADVAEYIYPARFPAADKSLLQSAAQETGQSINQLIVRCVEDRLPSIRAEYQAAKAEDLSPLPAEIGARALQAMTREERAEERALGRASARPK